MDSMEEPDIYCNINDGGTYGLSPTKSFTIQLNLILNFVLKIYPSKTR